LSEQRTIDCEGVLELTIAPTIVLTDLVSDYPQVALDTLTASGVPYVDADSDGGDPLGWILDAEVLLVTWYNVTRQVIEQLRRCRVIIRIGVGSDNIDSAAARERGIAVCNVPDYCQGEVADHAMALALSLARSVPFLDQCVRQGVWKPALLHPMPAFEVMSFGVLGFGRIGRRAIARARGFGFRLIACDPYVLDGDYPPDVTRVSLEELLGQSDILSIHAPLTPETKHLLNADRLALMKSTAILINTARGAIIETEALVVALQNGRLAAAGLDVFEEEPLAVGGMVRDGRDMSDSRDSSGHPLLSCPNVLLTPHYAWHSRESRPKLYVMAVEEAVRGARGEPLRSCVNGVQPRRC
jgi:phosphoglycerate dehydrogenase-like enzyme